MSAPDNRPPGRRVLVTGGIRSGKSAHAEAIFGDEPTTYLATGPRRDDAAWNERIRLHVARRPSTWDVVESDDVVTALGHIRRPCLLDDLSGWLTASLERSGAWPTDDAADSSASPTWRTVHDAASDRLVSAVRDFEHSLVIVTNEVGFGLVSPYASGRIFQDELGRLNQRIAQVCDRVVLVVSGCPLVIKETM